MEFSLVGWSDALLIQPVVHTDARGSFSRTWCETAFAEAGVNFHPVQGNRSLTRQRGTVRGMHFQRAPFADPKIVRCTHGRIHDVIVDLRPDSVHFRRQLGIDLDAERGAMLFVPAGFAHGFQSLTDDVVVEYLMGEEYVSALYDGFRHDDPALTIAWPEPVRQLSDRDRGWPDLEPRLAALKAAA